MIGLGSDKHIQPRFWPDGICVKVICILPRKVIRLSEDPIIHENYEKPIPFNNDIALLKLVEEVDVKLFTPACLPSVDADYTGRKAQAYGETYFEMDLDFFARPLANMCPMHN